MASKNPDKSHVAVLGWSLRAIEAIDRLDRDYVVVAPKWAEDAALKNDIPYVRWEFERLNDRSVELYETLVAMGVDLAVPLFEETVEWAGALNARFRKQPALFNQSLLFRDKSMMKRRAQLAGIRVGIFEEAWDRDDVARFLKRVNEALLKLEGDIFDPIHMKPFDRAGCYGHRLIQSVDDVDHIQDNEFPALLESHLAGQEFACEVFIHDRKIRFLNISEYVHLGYSVFIPASPELEKYRDQIRTEVEKLIEAFDIDYGLIHPEYFIGTDGNMYFGEVAYRVPGGNAFELIERAYGFNAYQGQILVSDPKTTAQELDDFFPTEVVDATGHAGCFLVYPKKRVISDLSVPDEVEDDEYFDRHDLFMPVESKVAERVAFGNHYGSVFFFGEDPERMRKLLLRQEEYDFYV